MNLQQNIVQTATNEAIKTLETLFETPETENYTELNEQNNQSIIDAVMQLLPGFISTIVNSIINIATGQTQKEPQIESKPEIENNNTNSQITQLEAQRAQLEEAKNTVTTEYVEALNNRTLMFTYYDSINDTAPQKEELNYQNLTSDTNSTQYRLIDPSSGKIICTDKSEVSKYVSTQNFGLVDENGSIIFKSKEAAENYEIACEKFFNENMILKPELNNPKVLHEALQNDSLQIQKATIKSVYEPQNSQVKTFVLQWDPITLGAMHNISSELYTKDDNAAVAKYEASVLEINSKIANIDKEIKTLKLKDTAETPEILNLELEKLKIQEDNEKISNEYVEALNNTTLMINHWTTPNAPVMTTSELTYETLTKKNNLGNETYRLIDVKTGKVAVPTHYETMEQHLAGYEATYMPELNDPQSLQKMIQDGSLLIQQCEYTVTETQTIKNWQTKNLNEMDISIKLYTDDDNAALAIYETKSLQNQAKLKELDEKINAAKTKYYEEQKAANETQKETEIQEPVVQKDYTTRQIERYEKYITKYEKQIEELEESDAPNKEAKIESLTSKIEKYMNKIQQLID